MQDMLVKLYNLDSYQISNDSLISQGITIRIAIAPDLIEISGWISEKFGQRWAGEATKAIVSSPSTCFIAIHNKSIAGFACYDATAKGFFGPTGVDESMRGKGVGRALLIRTLNAMYENGYAYAIIGGVGPAGFYEKSCGATIISDSSPGYFKNMISTVLNETD